MVEPEELEKNWAARIAVKLATKFPAVGLFFHDHKAISQLLTQLIVHALFWFFFWLHPAVLITFQVGGMLFGKLGETMILNIRLAIDGAISIGGIIVIILMTPLQAALFIAALFSFGDICRDGVLVSSLWDHFYLAVVTITTLGYGNIVPASGWSEFVAVIASVLGLVGFALLIGVFGAVMLTQIAARLREDRVDDE
jgi:hypothetical protein